MRNVIQDTLGNVCMLLSMTIVAQKMLRKKGFWILLFLCFVGITLFRKLYFEIFIKMIVNNEFRIYNMFGFAILYSLIVVTVLLCYECNIWTALFCGNVSYSLQHICQRLYSAISSAWPSDIPEAVYILLYIAIMLVSILAVRLCLSRLHIDRIVVDNKSLILISVIMIVSAVVLDLTFFRAMRVGGDLLRKCMQISSILISLLTILLQFSMVTGKRNKMELETIKLILEEERQQYYFEKSMIDLVNIKCHDLKHQIALLDQNAQNLLADTKSVIDAYDSSFHTGNVALDVALARKNFTCRKKNIAITCATNGESLNFIQEVDIYSLFGNILDNAIEATDKLEDQDKRIISLSVEKMGYFVNIHAENYFCDKFVILDGLPQTTKKDVVYHGFGLKSIRMLVDKYGGSLKIGTNEDRFVLDIMFPI